MNIKLDRIDQIIVDHLERDARMSVSDLAEIVELSRPAVSERIEKLQRQGVLKGYTAVVDHNTLGTPVVAFVTARRPGLWVGKAETAVYELFRRKEILEVHGVAGEDCLYLKVRVKDMKELNDLVRGLQQPQLNMDIRTITIVMNTYFEKVGGIVLMEKQKLEKSK